MVNLVCLPRTLVTKDRKSTRLNSSHVAISYAVFCLKKKELPGSFKGESSLGVRLGPQSCRSVCDADALSGEATLELGLFFFLFERRPQTTPLFPSGRPSV